MTLIRNSTNGLILSLMLFTLQFVLEVPTHATNLAIPNQIVVAVDFQYAPFSVLTPTGEPAGLFIDMWNYWSVQTGIDVKFLPSNWEDTLEALKDGSAQVHSGLFRSEERSEWMSFSEPIYAIRTGLFFRAEEKEPLSLGTFSGKNLGTVRGAFQHNYLAEKYPGIITRSYADSAAMVKGLLKRDVDAIFFEIPNVNQNLVSSGWQGIVSRNSETILSSTVHASVLKKNEHLIKIIDNGFRAMPPEDLVIIEKRWIPNKSNRYYQSDTTLKVKLNRDEQQYVRGKGVIRLASTPDWPPFEMRGEDKEYSGIAADFIRLAASKVGLRIKPVYDKWGSLVDMLKKAKLDVAPGLNSNPKRKEYLKFTTPYIEYYSAIFIKNDRNDIKILKDLEGKTVALEKGWAVSRSLTTKHPNIKLMLVDSSFEAIKAVSLGKADAYIGNQVVASYLIKKFTFVNLKSVALYNVALPGRLRFGVPKKFPLLHGILQKGLDAITNDERNTILSTYIDMNSGFRGKTFSLTEEQWGWLKAHDKMTLGIDPSWAPFEYTNEKGAYKGISSEYIKFISNKLKTSLKPVTGLSWIEALNRAREGRIDILPCMSRTAEREKTLLFSKPYLTFPIVIFSKTGTPVISGVNDLTDNKHVGIIKGYAAQEQLSRDQPKLKLTAFDNVIEAMRALSSGKIDYLVNDLVSGTYTIETLGLTNLKVSASTKYQLELSVAVRKDWPELVSIINKALDVITPEDANKMKSKWLSIRFEHGLDIWMVLKWVIPIAVGFLFIIGIIFLWNRQMGKEISERKKAEAALQISNKKIKQAHQKITDSIKFASLIQNALLPDVEKITKHFDDLFIIWEPKDVVGGDIFFFEELRDKDEILLLVIDCTGHGVPGAFVTALVKAVEQQVITEINNSDDEVSPAEILCFFNRNLKRLLKQESVESISNAGFDGGVLYYNKKKNIIRFAGAETPLFLVQNQEIKIIKGNRHSIGYKKSDANYEFTDHTIDVDKETFLYITTDGFLDQNGGKKGFPYGKKQFKQLLLDHYKTNFATQKKTYLEAIKKYQGSEEKNDDMTFVGLKIE